MKKNIRYLILFLGACMLNTLAAAIPKDVVKAYKSLISIATYDIKGNLLHSTNGFFVLEEGQALSDYSSFRGAYSASVVDADGKKSTVFRISGADDLYNLIKFTTRNERKYYLTPASADERVGSVLYLLVHSGKKVSSVEARVSDMSPVARGIYYTLSVPYKEEFANSPLVNAKGQLIGIVQKNGAKSDGKTYAISARTGLDLSVNALSFGNTTLKSIGIFKQIPTQEKEASTYIYLLGQTDVDSLNYLTALNDFVAAYPQNADGYIERAKFYGTHNELSKCETDISKSIALSSQKDVPHYTFSRIIYQNVLYETNGSGQTSWTLEKALKEADDAFSINPLPLYALQQGNCHYGLKQYQQAFDKFDLVNHSDLSSSETFFYAARAKAKLNASTEEIVALLDSSINRFQTPYSRTAAPYFWERAKYLSLAGKHREAVLDLNEYEHLIGFQNLNDKFYYMREQEAMESKLYQQAVDDINRCVAMQPDNYTYKIEKAALLIQVGQLDEAIVTARQAIQLNRDDSDGYKMLGIAYGEKKQKKLAIENLRKAKQLGDDQLDKVITEYSK